MYNYVICAVGLGSRERAEHLLKTSQALLAPNAVLHVVHVVERFPAFGQQAPDAWALSVIGEAEEKLALLCKQLKVTPVVEVRTGRGGEVLLAIAAEKKADLIVMAAHNKHDIIDRVFGSTVDHVVHRAKCSIHIDRVFP